MASATPCYVAIQRESARPAHWGCGLLWQRLQHGRQERWHAFWAWGGNYYGQLGLGDTTDRWTPTQVGTETDWSAVFCGAAFTLALKEDGSLWAVGDNEYGELGLGTSDWDAHPVPTKVTPASSWSTICCGSDWSLAIKTDGSLWAWGDNDWGELGLGATTECDTPT